MLQVFPVHSPVLPSVPAQLSHFSAVLVLKSPISVAPKTLEAFPTSPVVRGRCLPAGDTSELDFKGKNREGMESILCIVCLI